MSKRGKKNDKKNNNCDILKVDNMDKFEKPTDNGICQKHPLLPKHPFRMIICGSSGCGKSNLLLSLIKDKLVFEKLHIYSKHLDQGKYQYIKDFYDTQDGLIKDKYGIDFKTIEHFENNLDEMVECSDLNKSYKNLIIVDDFPLPTPKEKKTIDELYTSCRHKNTSIIFIGQMYFRISRNIRLNLSHLCIFNNNNNKELMMLHQELGCNLNLREFRKLYNGILNEKYKFLSIFNEDDTESKYRDGFEVFNISSIKDKAKKDKNDKNDD